MNQTRNSILVGVCAILAAVGLASLLVLFGELDQFLVRSYRLELFTDNSAGLRPGSTIVLNGVRVGRVDEIALQQDARFPVRVVGLIDHDQWIPLESRFNIEQPLIGGSATVALVGRPDGSAYLPTDGTGALYGTHRSVVEQVADAVSEQLEPLIEAMAQFEQISESFTRLSATLEALVQPQDPADVAQGQPGNIHTAIAKLNILLDDAGETIDFAQQWLGDEQLRIETRAAIEGAGAVFTEAGAAIDRYERLADSLESRVDLLAKQLSPAIDQLSVTLGEAHRLTRLATDGNGTVAQLLNNPDLYNSLNDSAIRLERTLVQLQLLVEKIKAEGLPVDF